MIIPPRTHRAMLQLSGSFWADQGGLRDGLQVDPLASHSGVLLLPRFDFPRQQLMMLLG